MLLTIIAALYMIIIRFLLYTKKNNNFKRSFRLELVQATWAGTRAEIKTAFDQDLPLCTGESVRIVG